MFLNNLHSDMFILGINDRQVEGQWVFDTDGSPLTWFSWADFQNDRDPPKEGTAGNCAMMMRHQGRNYAGHRPQDWHDINCHNSTGDEPDDKSLVCERYIGE